MDRIIRLNAVETSSPSDISAIHFYLVYPANDLADKMALIYEGQEASLETGAVPKALLNSHATTLTAKTTFRNTENRFTSLDVSLNQHSRAFSLLTAIRSIAFFTTVVVWAWMGKTEPVSHVRGKLVALGEPFQSQVQDFDKGVNTGVKDFQELKQTQLVAEIDREPLTLVDEVQKQQLAANQTHLKNIRTLMNKTRAVLKAVEKQATQGSSTKVVLENASLMLEASLPKQEESAVQKENKVQIQSIVNLKQDYNTASNRAISIVPSAKSFEILGLVYRVKVGFAVKYITNNQRIIKLKAGQTATSKDIRHRPTGIFLEPIQKKTKRLA